MNAFELNEFEFVEIRRIERAHETEWTDAVEQSCPCCGYSPCFWKREENVNGR